MTKRLILAALALGLAAPCFANGNGTFQVPHDVNKNLAPSLQFVGARVSSGTRVTMNIMNTSKLFHTGEGVFYGVEIGTGATTNYVVCFDTGAVLSDLDEEPAAAHLMMPCIANTTNSGFCGAGTTLSGGGWQQGRHFTAGLYCVTRVTSGDAAQLFMPLWRKRQE